MKTVRKFLLITAALILFIISSGLILQLTLLPSLVQKKIIAELNKNGFSNVKVKVKSITWWDAELENLHIGFKKKVHITKITVSYSLWSLIKGQVKAINIYGAQVDLGVKNRVIDLGPLSGIAGGNKSTAPFVLPFANLFLKESSLILNVEGQTLMVSLEGACKGNESNIANIDLHARMKNTTIKTSASVDLKTLSGKGKFTIASLDLDVLDIISDAYPAVKFLSGKGQLKATGDLAYQNGQLTGSIFATGDRLFIESSTTRKPLSLSINNLTATAVMDSTKNEITGSLSIEAANLADVSLSKITSSFQKNKNKLKITFKSALGPWATLNAAGSLNFGRQGLTGNINAAIPEFTTLNKKWLADLISPIKDDELGGTFSAEARVKIEKGQILQRVTLAVKNGEWAKSVSDTGIEGINGELGLDSLLPFITDGEQQFTFKSAHTGAFKVKNGQTVFNFLKNDILYIKSIDMNWAGGKLFSKDIPLDFSQSHLSCDLELIRK